MYKALSGLNGERIDPVSNNLHPGAGYRAYDPVLMRFRAPDTSSPFDAGGINTYAWCQGDPVNLADPSGHHSEGAWLGITAGVIFGILLTPVSGGSSLGLALSTLSVTSAAASAGLAIVQQFIEKDNPDLGAKLGWAALGTGILSGISSAALMRLVPDARTLLGRGIAALRALTNGGGAGSAQRAVRTAGEFFADVHIDLHPANAGPVQYYKGVSIEVKYTSNRLTDIRVTGFTSNFRNSGEPALILHRNAADKLLFTFRNAATRSGLVQLAERSQTYDVEGIIDYFRSRNIDLSTVSGDGALHLVACNVGGRNGAAQLMADRLNRAVVAYGQNEEVYHPGINAMGDIPVLKQSRNAPVSPITYWPSLPE